MDPLGTCQRSIERYEASQFQPSDSLLVGLALVLDCVAVPAASGRPSSARQCESRPTKFPTLTSWPSTLAPQPSLHRGAVRHRLISPGCAGVGVDHER